MAAHFHLAEGLGDLRHVAGNALTAGTAGGVMGMLLDRCRMRSVLRGFTAKLTYDASDVIAPRPGPGAPEHSAA